MLNIIAIPIRLIFFGAVASVSALGRAIAYFKD